MDEQTKKMIDSMSYESMLSRWRFAPVGDAIFQGETGQYYSKVMQEKAVLLTQEEKVNASKNIGWDKN